MWCGSLLLPAIACAYHVHESSMPIKHSTHILPAGAAFVFAFMAGNYGVYLGSPTAAQYGAPGRSGSSGADASPLRSVWGPQALLGWLRFWVAAPLHTFDAGYLLAWGARCAAAAAITMTARSIHFMGAHAHLTIPHTLLNIVVCLVFCAPPFSPNRFQPPSAAVLLMPTHLLPPPPPARLYPPHPTAPSCFLQKVHALHRLW